MDNIRHCKICGEPLSSYNKGEICEHCKNEKAKKRKGIAKGGLSLLGVLGGAALVVMRFISGTGGNNRS